MITYATPAMGQPLKCNLVKVSDFVEKQASDTHTFASVEKYGKTIGYVVRIDYGSHYAFGYIAGTPEGWSAHNPDILPKATDLHTAGHQCVEFALPRQALTAAGVIWSRALEVLQ